MRTLFVILFFAVIFPVKWVGGQTIIGNYYDAENQLWNLVEIRPTSGEISELGTIDGLASLVNPSSFVVDSKKNIVHFFGYDSNSEHRFYTVSYIEAEVLSSPLVAEDGWFGLAFNPNDSMLYVMRGVFDNLGTELVRFLNNENGTFEHVQNFGFESSGSGAVSIGNIYVSQGYEYYTTTFNGKYYALNTDINDSTQSFDVLCDYSEPEIIQDIRYQPVNDDFFALKYHYDNNNYSLVAFDPSTGQTQLLGDLTGYERSNVGGGILFDSGYYIFTGTYTGDTIQRVFSVDIETGEVVNDPALSLQVQIRGIDVDQNSLVGIAEASKPKSAIKVFPNPANQIIHFEVNGRAEYQVMDVFGKVLIKGNGKTNEQIALDVSAFAAGVYYLRTQNSAASFVIVH